MSNAKVVGIIGGGGWVGKALGLAVLEQGILSPQQLVVSSRAGCGAIYQDWPGVRCYTDNQQLAAVADVIVLSVRPENLSDITLDAADKLVISLLAMASEDQVAQQLSSRKVVRAMPNAAAEIRRAWFPWYAAKSVSDDEKRLVQRLLASCGTACEVSSERELDYLTALSGAGPAYPALLAQAMLASARQAGITEDVAQQAVMQTLVGGSLLLERLGGDPGAMVERLMDYNGTTARGLRTMLDEGFNDAVLKGLEAAYRAASLPSGE